MLVLLARPHSHSVCFHEKLFKHFIINLFSWNKFPRLSKYYLNILFTLRLVFKLVENGKLIHLLPSRALCACICVLCVFAMLWTQTHWMPIWSCRIIWYGVHTNVPYTANQTIQAKPLQQLFLRSTTAANIFPYHREYIMCDASSLSLHVFHTVAHILCIPWFATQQNWYFATAPFDRM